MLKKIHKVSVIIPSYNTGKFLPKCLDSVLKQTFQDFEIILVSDGPKEDYEICDKYAKKDKRITVIKNIGKGLGGARNAGLESANGQYVYFLDSDDYIEPETLETMISTIQNNDADLVVAGTQPVCTTNKKSEYFNSIVKYFNIGEKTRYLSAKDALKLPSVVWQNIQKIHY